MFSRRTGDIETSNAGRPFGDFWEEIESCAIAAVLTSVAGLEAYANELFVDRVEVFPDLPREVMAKLWELYEQKPPLEKFAFALLLRQAVHFDFGASPHQDVAALIRLRNGLTHYKPEWSDEQLEHAKISAALKHRAVLSPFYPKTESLFPRAWASHETTCWAVRSVVSFIREFEQRAGLPSRLGPFVERLNAL
jgi:hypothetical protein